MTYRMTFSYMCPEACLACEQLASDSGRRVLPSTVVRPSCAAAGIHSEEQRKRCRKCGESVVHRALGRYPEHCWEWNATEYIRALSSGDLTQAPVMIAASSRTSDGAAIEFVWVPQRPDAAAYIRDQRLFFCLPDTTHICDDGRLIQPAITVQPSCAGNIICQEASSEQARFIAAIPFVPGYADTNPQPVPPLFYAAGLQATLSVWAGYGYYWLNGQPVARTLTLRSATIKNTRYNMPM